MNDVNLPYSPDGFINAVLNLNGGAVVDELDRAMIDGLQAIHDNGGKAEITLKISLKHTQGLEKTITIENDVKTNFPQEKRPASLMFVTKGLGLVTQKQEQQTLPLAETDHRRPDLRPAADPKVSHIKPGA